MDKYVGFGELTVLQHRIMLFVAWWAREKKHPIPQKIIIDRFRSNGANESTIAHSINELVRKKYIRHAIITSNKKFYVQIRTL